MAEGSVPPSSPADSITKGHSDETTLTVPERQDEEDEIPSKELERDLRLKVDLRLCTIAGITVLTQPTGLRRDQFGFCHIYARRLGLNWRPILHQHLHFHYRQHSFPTAINDRCADIRTETMVLFHHDVVWTDYHVYCFYSHVEGDDRSESPAWYGDVWYLSRP